MRYEILHAVQVPKIGFGCWRIGGERSPDPTQDDVSLAALRSALELGYTHFDTAEGYAGGHSEELVGRAVREKGLPHDSLMITTKVSPEHLGYEDVLRACEASLSRLGMEAIDLYLIHWPQAGMNLAETFRALNLLVRQGKLRHLGVSNFNLKQLREAVSRSETPLLTNQVPYSFPDRRYVENGVLEYCQQQDILLTAYTPIKHRNINVHPSLKSIAQAHGVTPRQVALAWLTTQPRVITIPASLNPAHQAENIRAADLVLSPEEMEQLAKL